MPPKKIKIVQDLLFLNKLLPILFVIGPALSVLVQSLFYKIPFLIILWGSMFYFFILFYLPAALMTGHLIRKYKITEKETIEMHKDIRGTRKFILKLYGLPIFLVAMNFNFMTPKFLDDNLQGLGHRHDVVWSDWRFYHKDLSYFKNEDWVVFKYYNARAGFIEEMGKIKKTQEQIYIVTKNNEMILFSSAEILSKIKNYFPVLE